MGDGACCERPELTPARVGRGKKRDEREFWAVYTTCQVCGADRRESPLYESKSTAEWVRERMPQPPPEGTLF